MKDLSHTCTFVWILVVVRACNPEFKRISENVTLPCDSIRPIAETVSWWFNNQTQVDSSFPGITLSRPYGRSITILSGDVSVYGGDYSCSFANGTFINCYRIYIQGTCNDVCARLTVVNSNKTEFYQNSNVTFYTEVEPNLLQSVMMPGNEGVFILLKDENPINRHNISHTPVNKPNITFHLYDLQVSDDGVYQFVYSTRYSDLYTNRLSITIININPNNTTITSTISVTNTTTQSTPSPTPTAIESSKSDDDNIIAPIVGSIVGVIAVITGIVIACAVINEYRKRKDHTKAPNAPTPVTGTDEIASIPHQHVHLHRVVTVDNVETAQAEQDGHEHAQIDQ